MVQYTVPVGPAANEHETAPRRDVTVADAPLVRPEGFKCNTVYELVMETVERHGTRQCMGWRDVIEIHEEEKTVVKKVQGEKQSIKKQWLYYELSGYTYNTFKEVGEIMHVLGRGLVKMGLKPRADDKLHIYSSTSHKWMKMFLGAQTQGIPIVTAYDTLGEHGLIHSITETNSTAIFTENALLSTLVRPLEETQNIKYVIHNEKIDPEDKRKNGKLYKEAFDAVEAIKAKRPDIKFFSFDEIYQMGKKNPDIETHLPEKDDLCCIMYTSGSMGDPKGVVLKHYNIVAGVGGTNHNVYDVTFPTDRLICFLPLAHIFELAFELLSFVWGSCIGYGNPKTLTDMSVRNCKGDLAEFKPTIMVGVAAVWESVRKGIFSQITKLPYITQKIFWTAYRTKKAMQTFHIPGSKILGNLVFRRIKEATGGQLRVVLNGGSPISADAQEFITTLVCPMIIGYGLTETVASGTIMRPAHYQPGIAGDIVGSITVKLVDVEELGYFAKNNQGEIWIKGANVMEEYYKNPKETKASLTDDGWFMTGDIGEWTDKGLLKIIDRKKNLVKTLNGEYVALEKLESIYRANPYVANICVYADESQVKPVGIIVPNLNELSKLGEKLGIIHAENEVVEKHLDDKVLVKAVLDTLLKTGKDQGLVGIELLQGIVLFPGEWTPQNGFVTSAQKLKRKKILESVRDQVNAVYGV